MNIDKRFYVKDKAFSYNPFLLFTVGGRGTGKTSCAEMWCIDDFIATGKRFVWVRRYNTELFGDSARGIEGCIPAFTKKVERFYPNHTLSTKGNQMFVDGESAGTFVALSTSGSVKSVNFDNVDKIVYDEFIIMTGSKSTYLKNEPTLFLELISTILRPITDENGVEENPGRVWCLSNAISFANPYFYFFGIKPMKHNQRFSFDKERGILVEQYSNKIYENAVRETRFGKLIRGTEYESYAIDNEYIADSDEFILKKSKYAVHLFNIRYDNEEWGIYADKEFVYVTDRPDKAQPFYVFTKSDHTLNSYLLTHIRGTKFETLLVNYQLGRVMYDSILIKSKFIQFIALFINK